MTNEERAEDLLHHIILSWNNHHHQREDTVAIILAHDDAIRRECADNWEREWWGFPAMSLEKLNERASDEQRDDIRAYRSAIMGTKGADYGR